MEYYSQCNATNNIKRQIHRLGIHLEHLTPFSIGTREGLDPVRKDSNLIDNPTGRDMTDQVLHGEPGVQPGPPQPVAGAIPLDQAPLARDRPHEVLALLVPWGEPLGHEGLAHGRVVDDDDGCQNQRPDVQVDDGRGRI